MQLLILGAGWTSTFLISLCEKQSISFVATSRSGRDGTVKFEFDPDSENDEPYKILPDAQTVLITFPITKPGASKRLVDLYVSTRSGDIRPSFIQLGATSIWDVGTVSPPYTISCIVEPERQTFSNQGGESLV